MPQMAPLNWFSLYVFFFSLYMFLIILNYYMFLYPSKSVSVKMKQKFLYWKW
uniref:ATP synthase complex subunit 8 n=1 Tax=Eucryptorrhynchus scrobiculatus TaxID=1552824 RepID=A0A0D3QU85_EUCSC|nr:ATP synthase F0 subunit 8 [Eucryptorrhynchus scrobiculatus]AJR19205.1 ATP synthase F0 subunit 8 [Eucryptorrhynchus scrobiculatus]AJZ71915.1 ATP synthase F0 subunit 8 [Eucryptorrhynchus scrobiculatus]UNO31861.1 ATP synthase F0 subunit 8 [Eucryptorrhynchus scrobiculatus]